MKKTLALVAIAIVTICFVYAEAGVGIVTDAVHSKAKIIVRHQVSGA